MKKLIVVILIASGACTVKDPLFCLADSDCTKVPGRTKCDLTGEHDEDHISRTCEPPWSSDAGPGDIDAHPADAKLCTASTTSCSSDVLEVCGPDGTVVSTTPCALGCASTTRCYRVDPVNGLAAYADVAVTEPDVILLDGTTIDTDTGAVTNAGGQAVQVMTALAPQTGASSIRVLMARSFVLGNVRVQGGHPIAFVAPGPIRISGLVDVSGHPGAPGPGSGTCTGIEAAAGSGHFEAARAGQPAGTDGKVWVSSGGGGAGHAAMGAQGGPDVQNEQVGSAGAVSGVNTLVPLRGGCQGGAAFANHRGGGGGAVQLVSDESITIDAGANGTGVIDVGGGGGRGATFYDAAGNFHDCAGGGGSGGGVLLEAPAVSLSGTGAALIASGGGGAGGCDGGDGKDAPITGLAASGGSCSSLSYGQGGTGGLGAATSGALPGGGGTSAQSGGAGGGAMGRLRIETANAAFAAGAGTIVRGAATVGTVAKR